MKMELVKEVISQTRWRMTRPYNVNWTEQQSLPGSSAKVQSPQKHIKQDHLSRKHIEQTLVTTAPRMMIKFNLRKLTESISKTEIKETEVQRFP